METRDGEGWEGRRDGVLRGGTFRHSPSGRPETRVSVSTDVSDREGSETSIPWSGSVGGSDEVSSPEGVVSLRSVACGTDRGFLRSSFMFSCYPAVHWGAWRSSTSDLPSGVRCSTPPSKTLSRPRRVHVRRRESGHGEGSTSRCRRVGPVKSLTQGVQGSGTQGHMRPDDVCTSLTSGLGD